MTTAELLPVTRDGSEIVLSEGRAATLSPSPSALRATATPLPSPGAFRERFSATAGAWRTVREGRETVRRVLQRRDDRFLVVVGPCSIHDIDAALEYAERLAILRERYEDRLVIVMRAYFEKPRTTVGWRGLINDPHMDGTFAMEEGLGRARRLLTGIAEMGIPTAAELLDLAAPAYYADLISLASIGARTTESQPHRAMASGLGMPVGFKNGTDGSIGIAVNAIVSSRESHSFLGMDDDGRGAILCTEGNPDTALVLRGGKGNVPNYDPESVAAAESGLIKAGFDRPALLVDASHANSGYDPDNQATVCASAASQRRDGRASLRGVMIESNLCHGKQSLSENLRYGVSITDACLGWDGTATLLKELYSSLG